MPSLQTYKEEGITNDESSLPTLTVLETDVQEKGVEHSVLVVGGNAQVCADRRKILAGHGYRVDVAVGTEEGLRKVRKGHYDLVLLDATREGLDAAEAVARIMEIDPDMICVVVADCASADRAMQAIKAGAYGLITCPFTAESLLVQVEQGLERRSLFRRLERLDEEVRELAQRQAELEQLERLKTAFILTVAHELRAPAAAIQSYLRLILDGCIPRSRWREYLERVERRAQEQLELINDLLELARLQDPNYKARVEVVQMEQVLRDVLDSLAARAAEKRVRLECTIAPGLPPVCINPQHARQLWSNLIDNAIKYTPNGGRVRISLSCDGNHLIGEVSDTGIGIAREEIPRIFDEFYRTKAGKSQAQLGSGLGLSIVKRILDSYQGTIEVESEVGRGSSFTFRLPTAADDELDT